jgi:hypothetical protein
VAIGVAIGVILTLGVRRLAPHSGDHGQNHERHRGVLKQSADTTSHFKSPSFKIASEDRGVTRRRQSKASPNQLQLGDSIPA